MTSHLGVMVLFAALVSVVFATLAREEPAAQWRFAGRLLGLLIAGAYAAGWVMRLAFR